MSNRFEYPKRIDIMLKSLNKRDSNVVLEKSDGNGFTITIGPIHLKRWYSLKTYFSSTTNEEFVGKLLNIAEEYVLSESETTRPDMTKITQDIPIERKSKLNEIGLSKANNAILQKFEVQNYSNNQESEADIALLDGFVDTSKAKQQTKKDLFRLKRYDNCKVSQFQMKDENAEEKIMNSCRYCDNNHRQHECPVNNPVERIQDSVTIVTWTENYKNREDQNKSSFARISLPSCLTFLNPGIASKIPIKPFTEFGPLIGRTIKEIDIHDDCNMKDIWELQLDNGNIYVNTEDLRSSNWIRFIRPAPTREERNLSVIIKENRLYLVSIKSINPGDELLYWQDTFIANRKKKNEKTVCGGCNVTFDHPLYYRVHCSLFHDIRYSLTIRKYHCKVCGAAILGKENIRRHATEFHNGKGAYQCQFCHKFFLRLSYLDMHRTYGCSSNPLRSKSLCDFCGRKFCQPQKLKIHIKRMHSSITEVLKDFQCKQCMKILGSRAALQRHSKEVHEKQLDGSYSCKMCGKHFQNKSNLKIHMLTHSGIKPFKCEVEVCSAAFTTKQCLQLHYRKIHSFDEKSMPRIERSVSYTFKAYCGTEKMGNQIQLSSGNKTSQSCDELQDKNEENSLEKASSNSDIFDASDLQSPIDISPKATSPQIDQLSPSHVLNIVSHMNKESSATKIISKGSKKWIADEITSHSVKDLNSFTIESRNELNKNLDDQNLGKYSICEFSRRETSNASLLVEAALDSVCNEPSIDIDVEVTPSCSETLVNNIYGLSQNSLPPVSYNLQTSQEITLISPSVNDHISVTDELDNEIKGNENIEINYSNLQDDHFRREEDSPSSITRERSFVHRFPRSHEDTDSNFPPAQSPRRYDFVGNINTEHLSSEESNGIIVDNTNIDVVKHVDSELNISDHKKSTYKMYDYFKRLKFDESGPSHQNDKAESEVPDIINHLGDKEDKYKFNPELAADMRSKFEIDLDIRVRHYENNLDAELNRQRPLYDLCSSDLNARSKNPDLLNVASDNREVGDIDFRSERHFESMTLNSSELQGLDMSTRSFHNYPSNINRYHHLYPDIDRMDLRLNYTPPPPYDLVRVVSLDLTPPGRHSVDLSLRSIPLHQITNPRLLTEHTLSNKHRLFDQARLLAGELTSRMNENRLIPETSGRLLSDPSSDRILGSNSHISGTEQTSLLADESRLLPDHPRLIDQRPLLGDTHLLSSASVGPTPSMAPFGGYTGVAQPAYHTASIDPRTHVTSPANSSYHHPYSTYYQ